MRWSILSAGVHALRHSFGTLLSKCSVAPRTAQAAMRHSTIDLTMNTYTDPRLLDLHQAVASLPNLPLGTLTRTRRHEEGMFGDCVPTDSQLAPKLAPTSDNLSTPESITVKSADRAVPSPERVAEVANTELAKRNDAKQAIDDVTKEGWLTGLEPVTPRSTIKGSLVLSESQQQVAAPSNSVCTRVCTSQAESAHETASAAVPEATVDDDLAAVVHAWPNLPSPVRAGIVAMIRAASTAK